MKQNFAEVIRRRRNALGINQAGLAGMIGVSRNAVTGWETGHSRPDLAVLPSLCKALGISLEAFFGLERSRTEEENNLIVLFFSLDARDRESLIWQMEAIAAGRKREQQAGRGDLVQSADAQIDLPLQVKRPLHYLSVHASDLSAAAGFGTALDEAQGESIWLLEDEETRQADEVITVSGHSMEPTFEDGDRVLVRHAERLRPGEIGVFLVENEGYIKEYQPDGLHSHNPAYGTMTFAGGETVRCVGKVIGKLKDEQIPDRYQLQEIMEQEAAGSGREER